MHPSTRGRHAVNALVDLALRQHAGPVALATIATRQQVSLSYLEQLFSRLRRRGIVESTRGPGGGYTLALPADRISVAEVVGAVEDDGVLPMRGEDGDASHALWLRLQAAMLDHLAGVTLQSLVDEQGRGSDAGSGSKQRPRPLLAPLPAAQTLAERRRVPNSVFAFGQSMAG